MPDASAHILVDWKTAAPIRGLRAAYDASSPIALNLPDDELALPLAPRLPEQVSKSEPAGRPRIFHIPVAPTEGLEALLFKNRAELKMTTSVVAMHLNPDQRRSLFSAIDRLLDVADWEDESSQIDAESFRTYLRFTIFARPRRMPNLGVSPDGSLLAGWRRDERSVHVEFFNSDQCLTIIKVISERGPETTAWKGHVARLRDAISGSGAIECID